MPAPDPKTLRQRAAFGETVRRVRQARGWTQEELAHRTGFDRKSINRVENATYSPSVDRVFSLAAALDVLPGELMEDVDALPRRQARARRTS